MLGFERRTLWGRYLNHAHYPNASWHHQDGAWYAKATAPAGVEITIDYREGPWFVSKGPEHRGEA
jgi:hypothetical protein